MNISSIYSVCVVICLCVTAVAIFNKDCAERIRAREWGSIVTLLIVSFIPFVNLIPIVLFFNFNNFLDKPIHKG